jgi:hypothetical protein
MGLNEKVALNFGGRSYLAGLTLQFKQILNFANSFV